MNLILYQKRLRRMKNNNIGSNFDDFLKEEGILEEAEFEALRRTLRKPTVKYKNPNVVSILVQLSLISICLFWCVYGFFDKSAWKFTHFLIPMLILVWVWLADEVTKRRYAETIILALMCQIKCKAKNDKSGSTSDSK